MGRCAFFMSWSLTMIFDSGPISNIRSWHLCPFDTDVRMPIGATRRFVAHQVLD
jgi:hypothetical protein